MTNAQRLEELARRAGLNGTARINHYPGHGYSFYAESADGGYAVVAFYRDLSDAVKSIPTDVDTFNQENQQ